MVKIKNVSLQNLLAANLSGSAIILLITLIINSLGVSNFFLNLISTFACIIILWHGLFSSSVQKRFVTPDVQSAACNICGKELITTQLYCEKCNATITYDKPPN